jgi:hypothetical protein
MASYIENMSSKMGWDNVLQRGFPQPLDRSSMFSSLADAIAYASGGNDSRGLSQTSYIGQIITVFENDAVDVYKINASRELEPVGEGKGIIMATTTTETNQIASKTKSIGNLIFNVSDKTMYMVTAVNNLVEVFKLNDKNETVYDGGTY